MLEHKGRWRAAVILLALVSSTRSTQADFKAPFPWQKLPQTLNGSTIQAIQIPPRDPRMIYVGTENGVYLSRDQGEHYREVLRLPAGETTVHQIAVESDLSPAPEAQAGSGGFPKYIYAATNAGLYESRDEGARWDRIYFEADEEARKCFTVLKNGSQIFAGTSQGLFVKGVEETSWHQIREGLRDEPVWESSRDDRYLYFSTDRRLFRLDKNSRRVEKIFSVHGKAIEDEETYSDEDEPEEDLLPTKRLIKAVESNPAGGGRLFLATENGLYASKDYGKNWERFPAENLPLADLTSLKFCDGYGAGPSATLRTGHGKGDSFLERGLSPFCLWAATTEGAYLYQDGRWRPMYQGMETNRVYDLALDSDGRVYAATDKGVFYLDNGEALALGEEAGKQGSREAEKKMEQLEYSFVQQKLAFEPDVREIHDWAIDYAEVHPDKIKDWRRAAAKKAWLPSLSLGIDENRGWDVDDNVFTASSTIKEDRVGPDEKGFSHDLNWDARLAWDFSDLIWNSSQTSIDNRSKLMVELREDILDQVTRLYFERRRVQVEMMRVASIEPDLYVDQQMRLEELTAQIDALTGGKFSAAVDERLRKQEAEMQGSREAEKKQEDTNTEGQR